MIERLALAFSIACSTPATSDAGAPFCPRTGAALCADFETSMDPGAGFTGVTKHGVANGVVEMGTFVASVPGDSTTSSAFAPFWDTMDAGGELEIDLRFRADTLPAILTIAVASYREDQYAAAFQIAMGTLYVVEQRAGVIDSPWFVGRIPLGEWHDYALVVSPNRRTLEAKVDGQVSSFVVGANQKFTLSGKKTLSVGIADSSATAPATKVAFDNVAFFSR